MSSISFPPRSHSPESSSSTEHINAFRSAYSTTSSSSFQINPLSHHPPRTPRTSTFSSSQSPSSHSHSHSRTISQPSSFRSQNAYDYTTDVYASHSHPSATGLEGAGVGSGEIPGPNDDEKQMLKNLDIEVEEDAVVPDVDVEASLTVQAQEKVWSAEVWREMLKSVRGRDKAFKLIQYTLRVYLLFHRAASSSAILRSASSRTKWSIDFKLAKRFEDTASGLSLTRKCLILFDWLDPLTSILSSQPLEFSLESKEDLAASLATTSQAHSQGAKQPTKPLLHAFLRAPPPVLLDLVHAMSDDVYCMSRLGLLGKRTGERAGRFSDWCWFAATLIALVELSFERTVTKSKLQAAESRLYKATMRGGSGADASNSSAVAAAELELVRLRRQDFWLKVQRTKLLMDLVFVCYDVFKLKRARDTVKTFAGLASAVLSSAKIYHSHKTALVLKAMQR